LEDLTARADDILLAGDAVLQYRFSNDVMDRVVSHGMTYIRGNHEAILLGEHGKRALSNPAVRASSVEVMAGAPWSHERTVSGKKLLMVHGSPFDPYDEYLYPGSRGLARCAELDVDILVLGHTHIPMATRVGRTLVVNPGSLGQGGDPDHPGMLSYAVLDTDSDRVEVVRFSDRGERQPAEVDVLLPAPPPGIT
ncbi:MAG TPA: metallophosphoesterase family protein, partial [Acidimicrobiales bacterium]|nr:metallophosphoesterase family protein [Acidimicrobiales bacterium]